jgi:thiamine biosynthesis lipoprotein
MTSTTTSAPGRSDFVVLGTGAVVLTVDPTRLELAVAAARSEIDLVDHSCSRFRDDSDLERINASAGRSVTVGTTLLDALQVAIDAARWTNGDVDPTIGCALRLLGYDRDFADVRAGDHVARFAEVAGWSVIQVDHALRTVRIPAGVRLDLGATAKALAADRAAEAAASAAGCGVLVGLGGDLSCAGTASDEGWAVHVTDWHGDSDDSPGQTIMIHTGGLATSSTTVRRWQRGAEEMHHVVDPTTGGPASGPWRTVSVAAASCVQANVATTAAIVRGDGAVQWLDCLGVPARLVRRDGVVVRTGDWPTEADG